MTTMKILRLYFQYALLCEKCHNFRVPDDGDMADCFFLHDEMINYDLTNSIVLHFNAGIEENDILFFLRNLKIVASYLEDSLADLVHTHSLAFVKLF